MRTGTMPRVPPPVNRASRLAFRPVEELGKYFAKCSDGIECLCLLQAWPLHAHDEVVHAEQISIALNFVFHERLVADDEAIFDELLEGLLKRLCALGLLVEPPRRVSAVFVLERSFAFLERFGVRRSDIAFARDWCVRGEPLSRFGQQLPIHGHLRHQHAQMSEVGDQPRISEPRRTPHGRIHHCGEPYGRAALALRLETDPEIANLKALAGMRDLIFGPQPAHDLYALVHALCALLKRHVEGLELGVAISNADSQDVAATR